MTSLQCIDTPTSDTDICELKVPNTASAQEKEKLLQIEARAASRIGNIADAKGGKHYWDLYQDNNDRPNEFNRGNRKQALYQDLKAAELALVAREIGRLLVEQDGGGYDNFTRGKTAEIWKRLQDGDLSLTKRDMRRLQAAMSHDLYRFQTECEAHHLPADVVVGPLTMRCLLEGRREVAELDVDVEREDAVEGSNTEYADALLLPERSVVPDNYVVEAPPVERINRSSSLQVITRLPSSSDELSLHSKEDGANKSVVKAGADPVTSESDVLVTKEVVPDGPSKQEKNTQMEEDRVSHEERLEQVNEEIQRALAETQSNVKEIVGDLDLSESFKIRVGSKDTVSTFLSKVTEVQTGLMGLPQHNTDDNEPTGAHLDIEISGADELAKIDDVLSNTFSYSDIDKNLRSTEFYLESNYHRIQEQAAEAYRLSANELHKKLASSYNIIELGSSGDVIDLTTKTQLAKRAITIQNRITKNLKSTIEQGHESLKRQQDANVSRAIAKLYPEYAARYEQGYLGAEKLLYGEKPNLAELEQLATIVDNHDRHAAKVILDGAFPTFGVDTSNSVFAD